MLKELIAKFSTLAEHHQLFFAIIVGLCIVCMSWSIEQILDRFIFPQKKLLGYIVIIFTSFLVFWMVKHCILHAV